MNKFQWNMSKKYKDSCLKKIKFGSDASEMVVIFFSHSAC